MEGEAVRFGTGARLQYFRRPVVAATLKAVMLRVLDRPTNPYPAYQRPGSPVRKAASPFARLQLPSGIRPERAGMKESSKVARQGQVVKRNLVKGLCRAILPFRGPSQTTLRWDTRTPLHREGR